MKDCDKEILKFHDNTVKLSEDMRKELKARAVANEERMAKGLTKNNEPLPLWSVLQGSYAMRTTVQHPDNDYDIDDGAVFLRESLKGSQGVDKSALAARQMVCDAINADPLNNFSENPEVRNNCVRVYYKSGYHVDIPVYRIEDAESDSKVYELASTTWKKSSPEGVTQWFANEVKNRRDSSEAAGSSQLRKLVRLLKKFAISRASWNLPSGFCLTALVVEKFGYYSRVDDSFYRILVSIKNRLELSMVVYHPVIFGETITTSNEDAKMKQLKSKLEWAIDELAVLFEEDCTKKAALKAWRSVFNDSYFDELIENESVAKSFSILSSTPSEPVQKEGGGRFG